tara:strand:+ start:11235 stop:11669 length:435 start_codon:yes stop_codon:yes gene_type:complete
MPKSEAAVGLIMKNKTVALTGLATVPVSLLLATNVSNLGWAISLLIIGPGLGIIILDEENQEISFEPLEDHYLDELGLTQEEAVAYHENLDQLSLVANEIALNLPANSSVEDAKELWGEYGQFLNQEALSAAVKIINNSVQHHF